VLKLVQPGAIVLLHDVIPATARALPRILRIVKARKFTLVTVSELLKRDPPSLAQLKRRLQGCY
jgi:peptidoglycan/xylan/chitin deacetylase (PgdA/CDA1 family)